MKIVFCPIFPIARHQIIDSDDPGNVYLVDTLEPSRVTMKIFIVEDEPMYARMLEHHLSKNPDHEIELYASGKECLDNLYKKPAVVTVDYHLPDMHGSELLKKILRVDPAIAVIIISGQQDISIAIDLLKQGAYDYIVKDENTRDHLWNSLRLLTELIRLRSENERLSEEVGNKFTISDTLVGDSPGIHKALALVEKAASSLINVAITGETGTGKELIAKAIHYHSPRKKHPFIAINVGAIPKDLVESELFGYEKGVFTGAIARKSG
ncbi:MAG: sigma 54-interacting transcriptional regulator, partial [Candidatus Thermoplasmatota archaeon]